ncbi:hypothetical protein [Deinococcus radiotolerans]|uniref:Uncharacterized protein n=1 Tax=Deinococcus radiotolerans TaxID=1309407 RepID=A0ABQ2FQB7_9DEIO|nr:hypothetical protein [Deinococcus radiotolerans]GGL16568.1 hypothetical protein GCM10010844_39330 [Deinococcus radiotolerans]
MTPDSPAAALAHWWASFLPDVAPQVIAGDTSGAAATAALLNLLAARQIHTVWDAQRFEAALTTLAQLALDERGVADTWTDLAPIGLLRGAAELAGITLGNASLPVQSQAVARPTGVIVRLGVDGDWTQIWPPFP